MKTSDGLIKNLGENVNSNSERTCLGKLDEGLTELGIVDFEKSNLGKDLVGERARHDERRVAGGTSEVDKTTLGEEDDVSTVGEQESVNLGLDVNDRGGVSLNPGNVNLNVKVANVADNGVVGHSHKVLARDDVTATGGSDKDLTNSSGLGHGDDLVS